MNHLFEAALLTSLLVCHAAEQSAAFRDGFESNRGWFLFEEIVGENPCFGSGIGTMELTTERAIEGKRSLRLWANKSGSVKSNHLIAVKRLGNTGRKGKWTYSVHVYVPRESDSDSYQTGPEISIQNTRLQSNGEFLTHTAALQYQASRFLKRPGAWAIWREKAPGVGGWETIFDRELMPGKWYRVSLEVDYDNNRYGWLTVQGEDGKHSEDLTRFVIAGEKKHTEGAFAITLEGENLWNNCGAAGKFQQRFYYDDVDLSETLAPLVVSVRPSAGMEVRQRFQFRFNATSDDRPLSVVNVLVNHTLSPKGGCYLAYSLPSDALHLMNESGEDTLAKMPGNGSERLDGQHCRIAAVSTTASGSSLILELDITFNRETFAGNHTIFLAARDIHGGNSGWVPSGSWWVPGLGQDH